MEVVKAISSIQNSLPYLNSDWVLVLSFFIAFLFDVFFKNSRFNAIISFLGICISFVMLLKQVPSSTLLFNGFYQVNPFVLMFKKIITLSVIIAFVPFFIEKNKNVKSEYYYFFPLLVFSANLLCMSNHFLSIFLGIEFLSILTYLYIAFDIKSKMSSESSSKYIIFGVFSSAIMLYGISWIYSIAGTLQLNSSFLSAFSKAPIDLVAMSLILFAVGFLFKISAAPFHYYTPDVYEGSSPKTLSFISVLPKIAGLGILFTFIRHFQFNYQGELLIWPNFSWEKVIAIITIATLFIGNLSALTQRNLKRIMAYSSISHTGFLLIGILALSDAGFDAMYYYAIIFSISNIAVFYILHYWETQYGITELKHLVGLAKLKPFSSMLMVVILASLVGLPPLAGFTSKFYIFSALFEQLQINHSPFLLYVLIVGVVNTVIALFYYFNIARYLYIVKSEIEVEIKTADNYSTILLGFIAILSAALIVLGIFPDMIL